MDTTTFIRRIPAYVIDLVLICLLIWCYAHLFGVKLKNGEYRIEHHYGTLTIVLLAHSYYILQEYFFAQTIGKKLLKLKVKKLNNEKLQLKDVLLRNSFNTVELFLFPVIALTVGLFSQKHQRLGDMIAKTIVTDQSV
jgi:uncharacterized RDD family membrane protein YckC